MLRFPLPGWRTWFACGLLVLVGCGSGKVAVQATQGKVTMDGEAYGPASLLLIPTPVDKDNPKPTVAGQVDASGNIVFSCQAQGDGAPEGTYQVQFMPTLVGAQPKTPLPAIYGKAGENGLSVTIAKSTKESPNQVTIALESKPKLKGMSGAAAATAGGGSALSKKAYPTIDPSAMPKTSP